jgi:hypothetical protein
MTEEEIEKDRDFPADRQGRAVTRQVYFMCLVKILYQMRYHLMTYVDISQTPRPLITHIFMYFQAYPPSAWLSFYRFLQKLSVCLKG